VQKDVALTAPAGWTVTPLKEIGGQAFEIIAPAVEPFNDLQVDVRNGTGAHRAKFRVLGPQEAKGFPATQNVPTCPKCWGMQGYCICTRDAAP
jgi:hypothetical protein